MATRKPVTKKSSASRSAAAKKSTASTKTKARKIEAPKVAAERVSVVQNSVPVASLFPKTLPNIILAELVGTFMLTIVAMAAFAVSPSGIVKSGVLSAWMVDPLFIGLTLTVLVMSLGAISGAHVNPAVTFGLWVARKVSLVMVPVYWLSQFLGALLAIGVMNVMTKGLFVVSLANFMQFNLPLFFIELIGMAIFVFGVVSVVSKTELSAGAKAFGVGLSLTVALVAGSSMLLYAQNAATKQYEAEQKQIQDKASAVADAKSDEMKSLREQYENIKPGRPLMVNGAVLNPAVALSANENGYDPARQQKQQLTGTTEEAPAPSSRFGLEVIVGDLVGAAVGSGLFLLLGLRPKQDV